MERIRYGGVISVLLIQAIVNHPFGLTASLFCTNWLSFTWLLQPCQKEGLSPTPAPPAIFCTNWRASFFPWIPAPCLNYSIWVQLKKCKLTDGVEFIVFQTHSKHSQRFMDLTGSIISQRKGRKTVVTPDITMWPNKRTLTKYYSRFEELESMDAHEDVAETVHFDEVAVESVEPEASATNISVSDTVHKSKKRLEPVQGLLYHRTCKPDFLCSWPSLNSYLK